MHATALTKKMQQIYDAILPLAGESGYEKKILRDIALVADDEADARALYADSRSKRQLPSQ